VPSPAFLAISNGGTGVTAPKPTLTYAGNGTFTITNFNSELTYTVTGTGSRASNVLTVTAITANAVIFGTTPKGTVGTSTTAFRQQATQTFVQTGNTYVDYSPSPNGGTFYNTDQWNPNDGSPAGYYAVITPGYYQNDSYTGSGFTYSSTFNEWWKIV
jgi:hypothetical protein